MSAPAIPDPKARKTIEADTHAQMNLCWSCNSCDLECPINIATNRLRPQKIVRLANLGFIDELLSLPEIWYCLTCRRCDFVCPNLVKPSTVISYLRTEASLRKSLFVDRFLRYQELSARLQRVRWHVASQCLTGETSSISDDQWNDWLETPIKDLTKETPITDPFPSKALGSVVDTSSLSSCLTCGGCSGTCPASSGRSVFDPMWIFRMVYLGLEKEVMKHPSIWLCLACQRCSEVCGQQVKGHLIIQRLQDLALEMGLVDSHFPFRWYHAQKAIYSRYIKQIDALFMDQDSDDLAAYREPIELYSEPTAINASGLEEVEERINSRKVLTSN